MKLLWDPREVFLNLRFKQDIKTTNEIPLIIRVRYLCGSSPWRSAIINNFDKRAPFITQIQWQRLPRLMTATPICFN